MSKAPVAVVMLSLNEEHNMRAVLENIVPWAQEVFLVDSYSSDATVDIALEFGVHVVQREFRGFGDQWNFAIRELPITAPWTMKLDPDERLEIELKQNIERELTEKKTAGMRFSRRLWFMGKPLTVRQQITRMWKTGSCKFTDVLVNEHPVIDGLIVRVAGELQHHDSPDLHHWVNKQNHYTSAEAITSFRNFELSDKPRIFGTSFQRRMWLKKHFYKLPLRYTALFLYNYLVQGAWRCGWVGYAWARLRSDVYRMREFKLREMRITGVESQQIEPSKGKPDHRVQQY